MVKLSMNEKLAAVHSRTLKKIRIEKRLLAEIQKELEKFYREAMNFADKQRGSACSECASVLSNETEFAASVLSKGSKTAGMAARRKLLNLRIKRKLVEEEKRKLEEEEDKEKRKLEEEEDKWKLEEKEKEEKWKLPEEEDKWKLEEKEKEEKWKLPEDYKLTFYPTLLTFYHPPCDG